MASLQACNQVPYCSDFARGPVSSEVDQVLLDAEHPSEIFRTLYCLFKGKQKKVSMTFICRRAGIPSKGYLALVMKGQRRLHSKYWDSIFSAFKLNATQQELLRTRLELEHIDCPETKYALNHQLETLKAVLRTGS